MPFSLPIERRPSLWRPIAVSRLMVLGALLFAALIAIANNDARAQIVVRGGSEDKDLTAGVYLPTDRSLSRAMTRARERLEEGEYHQALTFLHDVLAREEDTFLERPDGATEQHGLKSAARQIIGALPPDGRAAYELLYSAAARRQLKAALATGDQDSVSQVVRQFCHTPAGYEAALVLAQMEADRGHHLAAAQLYSDLIDTPQAAELFEPQLSVLAAVNHLAAGQRDLAATRLHALADGNQSASIELAGRAAHLPSANDDGLAWLTELIGTPQLSARDAPNWLTLRGDPARNARSSGGAPHLRARWEARVVNDPRLETALSNRNGRSFQRATVDLPVARPIAVGDVVLMRTPYNIVAIDWHTGKRIWETREDDELGADELGTELTAGNEVDEPAMSSDPLAQRIWEDALVTSLASDGHRAFGIRSRVVTPQEEAMGWGVPAGFGGFSVAAPTTNQLLAYDLNTQGKLLWELDGNRTTGPLAGAFFLGAPLAVDNSLFVLAEIRSAIYLVALEPRTGQLRWRQQLVGLEVSIGSDSQRRLVGATPSFAGGILVCPTSAGVAVAIDVVKREFAWVYRYAREVPSAADARQMWQLQQLPNQFARVSNGWRDGAAIIDDGRVYLTPPESGDLHCLDLRTGQELWTHRRGNALFVGCIADGRVLLVGRDSVRAQRAEDGTAAWPDALPLPAGSFPSGQGYLSGGVYYLPVTTGGVVAIDLATGKLQGPKSGEEHPEMGNLICYRGSILSQSSLLLDKFEQRDVLERRAAAALAVNPNDATALRELAELKRADGDTAQAVRLLKLAIEFAPQDAAVQDMLAEVLLDALAKDFAAYRNDVPLVRRLVHDRQQEVELLRLEALGLDQLGERLPALDAYLRLADYTAEAPAELRISADYTVRSDRWVRGQLGQLWTAATPEERTTIAAQIVARRPTADQSAAAAELRHYLGHFAELPGAEVVRLQLARWLVDRRYTREAELEILTLNALPAPELQAAAAVLMTQLKGESGFPAEAAPYTARLAGHLKDVTTLDGKTGGEWLERLARDNPAITDAARRWPQGHVEVKVNLMTTAVADRVDRRNAIERQGGMRRLIVEQDSWPLSTATQWFVANDGSELVGRDGLGNDFFHLSVEGNHWARQYGDISFVRAARLGQVMIVSLGGQILAVDSRRGEAGTDGDVLWQAYPRGRFAPMAGRVVTVRQGRRPAVFDSSSSRKRIAGSASLMVGALGPVTPKGCIFQVQDELKCIDPLTGETLWLRTDVPFGCELFGDEDLVFAADIGERVASVYRVVDGRLVGKRKLPDFPWMLTAGHNVAQRGIRGSGKDRKMFFRVTDVQTQQVLFEAEYDDQSQMTVVEPQSVAVYDPSGKFQLVDVRAGRIRIDQQLQPVPDVQSIRTLESGGQLFLMINTPSLVKEIQPVAPVDNPLIHGMVYAFDVETGEPLWPGPAVVRNRGLVMGQPRDVPFLIFLDRKSVRGGSPTSGAQIRLLCIDKRTGRTAYRNDEMRDAPQGRFRIRAQRDATPMVIVESSATEVYLTMSDQPRPPQPPANDDLESPRTSAERGLLGVGRRMAGALQSALEKSAPNRAARPPAPPNAQGADNQNAEQTDDD